MADSKSWGLGTCIPKGLLGPSGYLPLRQTKIESIRLVTDGACGFNIRSLNPICLGAFKHLEKIVLGWITVTSPFRHRA